MAKLGNGLHLFHKCGKTYLIVEEKKLYKTLLKLRISVKKEKLPIEEPDKDFQRFMILKGS